MSSHACCMSHSSHLHFVYPYVWCRVVLRVVQSGLTCGAEWSYVWCRVVLRVVQSGLTCGAEWSYAWCRVVLRVVQSGLTCGAEWSYVWCRVVLRVVQSDLTCGAEWSYVWCTMVLRVVHNGLTCGAEWSYVWCRVVWQDISHCAVLFIFNNSSSLGPSIIPNKNYLFWTCVNNNWCRACLIPHPDTERLYRLYEVTTACRNKQEA